MAVKIGKFHWLTGKRNNFLLPSNVSLTQEAGRCETVIKSPNFTLCQPVVPFHLTMVYSPLRSLVPFRVFGRLPLIEMANGYDFCPTANWPKPI
jgi:hypothetical protein